MKKILYKYFYAALILSAVLSAVLTSCSEDENNEQPLITNVRVTAKDSTIALGQFNLTIAIQGSGLGSVQKVLFNDVEADLNPVYVTSTNIICQVPDNPPTILNNKITVVTASGQTATYDFVVILPEPIITGVYNEFALPKTENKVLGQYFYVVSKVLVGNTEVEIKKVTGTEITFTMPENVETTTVTVISEGGIATSTFRLQETEGNMVNFDIPATTWGSPVCYGGSEIVDPVNSQLPVISGHYTQLNINDIPTGGWWDNARTFATCGGFDFKLAAGSHENKIFKFEANIVKNWKAGYYSIRLGNGQVGTYVYKFKPWDTDEFRSAGIKTSGWKTFYIPLSEFHKVDNNGKVIEPFVRIDKVSELRDFLMGFGNDDKDADGNDPKVIPTHHVALDNFRIVDK